MKRLIFVICAILCSSLFVSAKDFREVVYLKNGSITLIPQHYYKIFFLST